MGRSNQFTGRWGATKKTTSLILAGCFFLLAATAQSQNSPELVLQTGHASPVLFLAFSADGKSLLSRGNDGSTRVWGLRTHTLVRTWDQDATLQSQTVAISPSGDHLLFGRVNGNIEEVDIATGIVSRTYRPSTIQNGKVFTEWVTTALAESPDGKWISAANDRGGVVAFGVNTNSVRVILQKGASASNIWFSANSDGLLARRDDGSLLLYAISSNIEAESSGGFPMKDAAASAAFAPPDGHVSVADVGDGHINLYNLNLRSVQKVSCHCLFPMLSGDGKRFAAVEGDDKQYKRVRVWSATDLRELPSLVTPRFVYGAAISNDGNSVAFGGFDGSVSVATANGLEDLSVTTANRLEDLSGHLRTPRSLQLVSRKQLMVIDTEGGIREWNLRNGSSMMTLQAGALSRTTLSANARFVALVGEDHEIILANPNTGEYENLKIRVPDSGLYSLSVSEDGNAVAWTTGTIQTDIKALERLSSALAGGAKENILRFDDVVSANTMLYTARRQERWNAVAVCRGESMPPVGAFYGRRLLAAYCAASEQSKLGNPKWKVCAVGARADKAVLAGNKEALILDSTGANEIATNSFIPTSLGISPTGHLAAIMDEQRIIILDLDERKSVGEWMPKHPINASVFALSQGASQIAVSDDGVVYVVDGSGMVRLYTENGNPLVGTISVGDQGWLVVDEVGHFDAADIEGLTSTVKWRESNEPARLLPLEAFMRDYYTPKLLSKVLRGENLPVVRPIASLNRAQPKVEIGSVDLGPRANLVRVRVKVASQLSGTHRDGGGPLESGVFDLRLFRDGQLVGEYPELSEEEREMAGTVDSEAEREAWRKQYRIVETGERIITIPNVQLPQREGVHQVVFTAYAFNRDRVKSKTSAPFAFRFSPPSRPRRRRAYLITMATNANQSGWDLTLAVRSAKQATELWTKKLMRDYEVLPLALEANMDDKGVILPNASATKANLRSALDILAGREKDVNPEISKAIDPEGKLRAATPDDAVVLYIASHGYADPQGRFYVIPYDTGTRRGIDERLLTRCQQRPDQASSCVAARAFLGRSISSDDLSAWWEGVDAGKMVMVLDSCHSASVPGQGFRPGPLGDRGFGQLSYDKGMQILAATQPDKTARATNLERLEHTLLVEALRTADQGRPDQSIDQWLRATESQLPQRAQELYPELKEDDLQLPELMDFANRNTAASGPQGH
jgi:WD40 repeat protein